MTSSDAPAIAIETSGRLGSVAIGRGPNITHTSVFSANLKHAVELLPTIHDLCQKEGIPPSDIDTIFVSGGPGSFTGLRLGITVAKTFALAASTRVVRVPTLDVIAQNALNAVLETDQKNDPDTDLETDQKTDMEAVSEAASEIGQVAGSPPANLGVVLDAKRKQVFAATYVHTPTGYVPTTPPAEITLAELIDTLPRPASLMGEGLLYAPLPEGINADANDDPDRRISILHENLYRPRAEIVYALGRRRAAADDFDDPKSLIPIYVRRPEAEEVWDRKHAKKA